VSTASEQSAAAVEGPAPDGRRPRRKSMAVTRRTLEGPSPLSLSQEQLWFISRVSPEAPTYNEAVTIRKDGHLDLDAFSAAFNEILRRHEAWRTTFSLVDDTPVQIVRDQFVLELPVLDLSGLDESEAERHAEELAADMVRQPYPLEHGPLLRAQLVRFSPVHHRLYLAIHHLIFDGVSLYRIVLPELVQIYDAFVDGKPSPLPDPVIRYRDYALWEREWIESSSARRKLDYWKGQLAGAPALELPIDHPRPPEPTASGVVHSVEIPKATVSALRLLGQEHGATLFQVIAASFAVFLQRYCGQDEVVFGTVCDLRQRPELSDLVGYCLTPLVLRCDLAGAPTFVEVIQKVRNQLIDALDNLVPFERVVRETHPTRTAGMNPVFQALLVLEPPATQPSAEWSLHQMENRIANAVGATKFDLDLELDERPEGHLAGRLAVNVSIFEPATAARMCEHWVHLLEEVVRDPHHPLSELSLLSEADRRRQLLEWNATKREYPSDLVHELVAEQRHRDPGAIAVTDSTRSLTYLELDSRANQLAHHLRANGVMPGSVVAVRLERSVDMVVGLLAVMKAGGVYLPLDPSLPRERTTFMMADAAAACLLVDRSVTGVGDGVRVVALLSDEDAAVYPDVAPEAGVDPGSLLYILYTSGTTGRPKGVGIRHSSVVSLLGFMATELGLDSSDRFLAITTYSFDIATVELWLPLVIGAQTFVAPSAAASDPRVLVDFLQTSGATFLQATPTTLTLLVEAGWRGTPGLKALSAGEPLLESLAAELLDRCAVVWNGYGPTETTVYSTMARVERGTPVTIGRPIANTQVYVVDQGMRPVPIGVTGELLIGGAGVAGGYVNNEDLTTDRFVHDRFRGSGTLYRSGDLAKFLPDGRIAIQGRRDQQLKIRGLRIEPGEVESLLLTHPTVAAAVVVAREHEPGDTRLVAYVVPADGQSLAPGDLRTLLRTQLPPYMVPDLFTALEELPRTTTGKVDRGALPEVAALPTSTAPSRPTGELEVQLLEIWARTLRSPSLGVEDDFFDAGGHSLLAVRLLSAVERRLKVRVPLSSLLEGGRTVRGMAALIENDAQHRPPVSHATAAGTSDPLFFVHSDERTMLTLRHFKGPLGQTQEVISLLPERVGWKFDRSRSIEDLALPLLEAIRAAQPEGPYFIAGYSFGGLVAYELAGRLIAAGETIGWLGLLDTLTPAVAVSESRTASWPVRLVHRVGRGPRATLEVGVDVLREWSERCRIALHLAPPHIFDWHGAFVIVSRYTCPGNTAPLTLFVPDQLSNNEMRDPGRGWNAVHAGPIVVNYVPGDHTSMVTQPNVGVVADLFAESLGAAQQRQ
jgi:amino acid adenylation domain-containing protein